MPPMSLATAQRIAPRRNMRPSPGRRPLTSISGAKDPSTPTQTIPSMVLATPSKARAWMTFSRYQSMLATKDRNSTRVMAGAPRA